MDFLIPNWHDMFVPKHGVLEMIVRGTIMYLGIFSLLRIILKRQSGGLSVTDVLLVVLLADAAQNGMANEYRSVTEGIVLVATIIFWDFAIDWLGFHFAAIDRLIRPAPLLLVDDGRPLRRNMRRELVTMEELLSHLREQGVTRIDDVVKAYVEPDGRISVEKRKAAI